MIKTKLIYIAFYKPYGVLSQFSGDDKLTTLEQFKFPKGVYPVGRLDKDSEGLLLLSNDGPFINQLLAPENEKEKTYWVQVENIPSNETLKPISMGGIQIENYQTKKGHYELLDSQKIEQMIPERVPPVRFRKTVPTSWVEISIHEGKNRQVRKMTASLGHPTLRLIRIKIGKYSIFNGPKLNLAPGEWCYISKSQIL